MAEVYANLLALTVLEDQDRESLEEAYWGARDGDKAVPKQQPTRSEISRDEQQSEARVLTRNRGLIALEILGDHELSRDCSDPETKTEFEDQTAVAGDRYYQLKEFLESLSESEMNPGTSREKWEDLAQFGHEIGARLDCLVQQFNMQSRQLTGAFKASTARPAGLSVRLADDDLIRRITPVSIFNANPQLLYSDPVPDRRLSLFLGSQARRVSEDRWYGEESREHAGQTSAPYHERVARAFQGDVKAMGLPGDAESTTTSRAAICALLGLIV